MKRSYEEVAEANEETKEEGDQAHESGRGIFVHSSPGILSLSELGANLERQGEQARGGARTAACGLCFACKLCC